MTPSRLPFEIIRDPAAMRARAEDLRRDGRRIAVVPTMGYLHEGHLALLRAARARADVVILTIFVNPTQFGPGEDLARYPRDEAGDIAKARTCGTDLAFCPDAAAMYPPGHQTHVEVGALSLPLCGAARPGHFRGVATVVTKLLHLTTPHLAVFGEKDFQQLAVIRQLAGDLDFGIEIVGVPIVREPDGLAMSSRNAYLSPQERTRALALSRGLAAARELFAAGERRAAALVAAARGPLEADGAPAASAASDTPSDGQPAPCRIDYVELRDAVTLAEVTQVRAPCVLAVAAWIGAAGATRLIDNAVLDPDRP